MLFSRLLGLVVGRFGRRQRGQGVIEYLGITAAVAIVAAAGLQAVTSAQQGYFEALPLTPSAPIAPGSLLHPTSIDPPNCAPANVALGGTIKCAPPVIHDIFQNVADRNPPRGWIGLHVDNEVTPRAVCQLLPATSGDQNACAGPYPLIWTTSPGESGLLSPPTHNLSFWYECRSGLSPCNSVPGFGDLSPLSNHFTSQSASQTITFQIYQFAGQPQCKNALRGNSTNKVEIGRPLLCEINVVDLRTAGPAAGVDVMWKAAGGTGNGVPQLTCYVGDSWDSSELLATIFLAPQYNQCDPLNTRDPDPTLGVHCTTDALGKCNVIYRRSRELSGSSPLQPGTQDLFLSAQSGALTMTAPAAIQVVDPYYTPNQADTWLVCNTGSGVSAVATMTITQQDYQNNPTHLTVNVTSGLSVTSPSATASCQAFVVDNMPSTGNDCVPGPNCGRTPDRMDGYAPVGDLTFNLCDVAMTTCAPIASCNVQRSNLLPMAPPGVSYSNGSPYSSDCGPAGVALPLSGSAGQTFKLVALYSGSTHVDHTHYAVTVQF